MMEAKKVSELYESLTEAELVILAEKQKEMQSERLAAEWGEKGWRVKSGAKGCTVTLPLEFHYVFFPKDENMTTEVHFDFSGASQAVLIELLHKGVGRLAQQALANWKIGAEVVLNSGKVRLTSLNANKTCRTWCAEWTKQWITGTRRSTGMSAGTKIAVGQMLAAVLADKGAEFCVKWTTETKALKGLVDYLGQDAVGAHIKTVEATIAATAFVLPVAPDAPAENASE